MPLKLFLTSLFLAVFSISLPSGAEQQETGNLILKEMAALDSAFKTAIDAVVLNEPEKIASAFGEVQKVREDVEGAVKKGVKITLPKNQKRFREFVRMDDKFHRDLEILLSAAKKKRMWAVQRQTHRLLDACVRCHTIFRK